MFEIWGVVLNLLDTLREWRTARRAGSMHTMLLAMAIMTKHSRVFPHDELVDTSMEAEAAAAASTIHTILSHPCRRHNDRGPRWCHLCYTAVMVLLVPGAAVATPTATTTITARAAIAATQPVSKEDVEDGTAARVALLHHTPWHQHVATRWCAWSLLWQSPASLGWQSATMVCKSFVEALVPPGDQRSHHPLALGEHA